MSRGGSYGGGKSSLSYLFEPEEANQTLANSTSKQTQKSQAKNHEKTDEGDQTGALVSKPEERPQTKEDNKTNVVQEGNTPQKRAAGGAQNLVHFYYVSKYRSFHFTQFYDCF
jgi:hypothetical protein